MHYTKSILISIKQNTETPFTHTPGSPPPIKIEDESCEKALIYFMMKWIYLNLLVMETCFQNHPQTVH